MNTLVFRGETFRNLSPHDVTLCTPTGETVFTIPGLGKNAPRVSQQTREIGEVAGMPLTRTTFDDVDLTQLPDSGFCIVSLILAQAIARQAPDQAHRFLVPQGTVRNDAGQIIGCTSFTPANHV